MTFSLIKKARRIPCKAIINLCSWLWFYGLTKNLFIMKLLEHLGIAALGFDYYLPLLSG